MPVIPHVRPRVDQQVALLSILGFWLFYMIIVTLRAAVLDFPAQEELVIRRVAVTVFGVVVNIVMYFALRWFEDKPLTPRIVAAVVGSVPAALAISVFNYYAFNVYDPMSVFQDNELNEKIVTLDPVANVIEFAISSYYFLSSWAMLYLALSYAAEVRTAERRAARFAQAAQQAELRSLRYQVNPHFLFNTLNSLSTLVLRNRPDEAESMIMNLSTFYRTSLTGDPLDDVPLADEVQLQQLYLAIEAVRFPDRLRIEIDIPDELMNCCVPGLILQPLVENAIKYGVARATRPVTIRVAAREADGVLRLTVSDDGDVIPTDSDKGSGIGLANVRDRLDARYRSAARIEWHAPFEGGFVVELTLPAVRHDC
ncbi:histidine kinase [Blastomonas sp. AAP53]|uniref:sensor histidine kinase n=1 Tax=Blastomonas sp. AAP53 TaxID=1248760 RepID=UPI000475D61C|nr:histidine kinase [Blastomonas sp. AAP53]